MIGERMCRLRSRLALTTAEMAELLEVDPRAILRWEVDAATRGPSGATLVVLRALEDACTRDPSLAERMRDWVPKGQLYVLRRLSDGDRRIDD
jgi:hypothetical protein